MHFIIGGAFNGKRNWVKEYYELNNNLNYYFMSGYKSKKLESDFSKVTNKLIIIEGIEQYIKETVMKFGESSSSRDYWRNIIKTLLQLESNYNKEIILIGTDITKGIVPMEKMDRIWRDTVGWIYQDIVNKANRVDLVIYGIGTRLK